MTNKLIVMIAIAMLILGIVLGRIFSDRYYFMEESYKDVVVIYRCNKFTGKVEAILKSREGIQVVELD